MTRTTQGNASWNYRRKYLTPCVIGLSRWDWNLIRKASLRSSRNDVIALARSMGLPSEEIASLLIDKITALMIEHELPKCVRQFGDATLISMPLDDLRFVYGYLALVEARAPISLEQTKRANKIVCKLLPSTT
jgi:hypothetical protein